MNFPDPNLPPIIIVDDSQDDAFLLRYRLRLGQVFNPLVTFEKSTTAIAHLRSLQIIGAPPLMLFADVKMPGGFELLAAARGMTDLEEMKVVVLTYSNHPADLKRALDLRVDGYLIKLPDADFLGEYVRHGPWFDLSRRAASAPVAAPHALCA